MKKHLVLAVGVLVAALIAPAGASADPGYYCKASSVRATLLGTFLEPVKTTRPFRPCEDDTKSLASLPANPLLTAALLEAHTNDFPRRPDETNPANPKTRGSLARANIARVALFAGPAPGLPTPAAPFIEATALKAQVDTTCASAAARPVNTGSGGVASLSINGVTQTVLGTPNQVITIPQVGTLTVNYQKETGSGFSSASPKIMTRRALYLDIVTSQPVTHPIGYALGPILGSNVVVSEAVAGFEGVQTPCSIPIPAGA